MSETWMIAGVWIAAGLTIFLFSFLYKDNPFFKIAEHLYLGAGMGWWFQVYLYNIWIPKVWDPLAHAPHDWGVLIPAVLGLSLVTQFIPKISWVSRYGFTFLMGYGAGLVVPASLATDFMSQIVGTIKPFSALGSMSAFSIFNALLIAVGVISVLFYFFFSVEHKGAVKKVSNFGIYFLMVYFGAAFGNTVMARFSLLYGRFDELNAAASAHNFYATQIILAAMVLYFLVHGMIGKKPSAEEAH
ncbi:MAG: hypothetical protein M0011_03370 [Elusimicrobia bacterium]|nr:hypothetical protein [Elusimicrobiota bacterium]